MNKDVGTHRIPGTQIFVDYFHKPVSDAGCLYVLSHFHGDHYGRLSDRWDAPVHCSPMTARLAETVLGVNPSLLRPHALHEPFELGGALLEFMDAEHCPGAVMILATVAGEAHLHTGDFRATPRLLEAVRRRSLPKVQTLFMDTTYALSKRSFADQTEVIERIAAELAGIPATTLVLVGAYSVGKERVIFRLASQFNCRIYTATARKKNIYGALDLSDEDRNRFTDDPAQAQIHIVSFGFCGEIWPYWQPNFEKCEKYLKSLPFDALVGVLPTGHADASNWNRNHEVVSKGDVTLRLYSYSEHSSAKELQAFVRLVRPERLVPTVFRDKKDQDAVVRRFHPFLDQAAAVRSLFGGASSTGFAGKRPSGEEVGAKCVPSCGVGKQPSAEDFAPESCVSIDTSEDEQDLHGQLAAKAAVILASVEPAAGERLSPVGRRQRGGASANSPPSTDKAAPAACVGGKVQTTLRFRRLFAVRLQNGGDALDLDSGSDADTGRSASKRPRVEPPLATAAAASAELIESSDGEGL